MKPLFSLVFALSVLGISPSFGATAQVNNIVPVGGISSVASPAIFPAGEVTVNSAKYVTISACPVSATAGNNYYFVGANGVAYQVPGGQRLVVQHQTWYAEAASAAIMLTYATTAPTWNSAVDGVTPVGIFWDTVNTSTPFKALAASAWYTSNMVFEIPASQFPYIHSGNTTSMCLVLEGTLVP